MRHFDVHRRRHVLAQERRRIRHFQFDLDRAAQRIDAGVDVDQLRREALPGKGVRRAQRLLAERKLRQVALVDFDHDLGLAARGQQHQLLAGLHHIPRLDAARDEHAVHRGVDHRLLQLRLRRAQVRVRLIERRPCQREVAAGRSIGLDLEARSAQLALGDIQVAPRVVELRLADEAAFLQRLGPVVRLPRLQRICLRLREALLRRGQRDFAQLAQLRFGLGHARLGLRQRGALVRVVELDQDLAPAHALAFLHRNARNALGDHRPDRNALRRHDAAARDHGLYQVAARRLIGLHGLAENQVARRETDRGEGQQHYQRRFEPPAARRRLIVGRIHLSQPPVSATCGHRHCRVRKRF